MDPISLLVSALAAGAQAALKDTASAAVKDAYSGLKALLLRKFGNSKPSIEGLEQKPDSKAKQASIQEDLQAAGAADDAEVLAHVQTLLRAVHRDDPQTGAALGLDFSRIEADFLTVGNIHSAGTAARLRDSHFSGGISIGDVDAGGASKPGP